MAAARASTTILGPQGSGQVHSGNVGNRCQPGQHIGKFFLLLLGGPFTKRAAEIGYDDFSYADNPVVFWDLFGEQGHPVRTTISEMGPLLLGRLLQLNDTQAGVLEIAFRAADDEGLLLLADLPLERARH